MNKRLFLQALVASGGVALVAQRLLRPAPSSAPTVIAPPQSPVPATPAGPDLPVSDPQEEFELVMLQESELHPGFKHSERLKSQEVVIEQLPNETLDQYLEKIRNFDADYPTDIFLSEANHKLLLPTLARLDRVQNFVGHANFNLIGFEETLYFARNYEAIGKFEPAELAFMEEIFHADAKAYGFFGDKITPELNNRINQKDVEKISGSGHYLIKGSSLEQYRQIKKDVGNDLTLTSGIRNNIKQMHLFLAKAFQSDGNLSRASRSLAPPGHSYHGVGDFDVGKVGMGESNFTSDFSQTPEYKRLISLGYVDIRYTDTNMFGVRYEPWHIKVGGHGDDCCHNHG
jgi:D-alanyl-D-alanine carboxypeptidase